MCVCLVANSSAVYRHAAYVCWDEHLQQFLSNHTMISNQFVRVGVREEPHWQGAMLVYSRGLRGRVIIYGGGGGGERF